MPKPQKIHLPFLVGSSYRYVTESAQSSSKACIINVPFLWPVCCSKRDADRLATERRQETPGPLVLDLPKEVRSVADLPLKDPPAVLTLPQHSLTTSSG